MKQHRKKPPQFGLFTLCVAFFLGTRLADASARADLCSLEDAFKLFQASRQWLDIQQLGTPLKATAVDFSSGVAMTPTCSATAAGVVLRLHGRPVGQAWEKQQPNQPSCLAAALLKALGQANNDRVLSALPADLRAGAPRELALEIELVGDTSPLPGDRVHALSMRIDNARQAMAIRAGDRWAFSLPSLQQSLNQTQLPWYTMVVLAREVGVEVGADTKFQLPQGVVIYRADTRRLAQITAKDAPFEVSRGSVSVPLSDINATTLDQMAQDIATHLERRIRNTQDLSPETIDTIQSLGPGGEYQPALGTLAQQVCPPLEQAMSAYAMAKFSGMNVSEQDRLAARSYAEATLRSLQKVIGEEKDPLDQPAAAAACLLACQAMKQVDGSWGDSNCQAWQQKLKAKVLAQFQQDPLPDLQAWSLCAAALAPDMPAEVSKALQGVWSIRPVDKLLSASPWLLTAQGRVGMDSIQPSAKEAVRALLAIVLENQLTRKLDPDLADDLVGGWSIGSNGSQGASAQSSRPALTLALAMTCAMAQHTQANMDSLKLALRFLKQLQVDQPSCYAFRDPKKALGGIRSAPWDSAQPLGANAMTLLAILEARQLFSGEPHLEKN